jgi:hypothetical protein
MTCSLLFRHALMGVTREDHQSIMTGKNKDHLEESDFKRAAGSKSSPEVGALAIAFYAAARAEAVQRISLRDTTLLAWIATCGVLLGLAVKDDSHGSEMRIWIAELLPAVSLAFGLAIYRHSHIMGLINSYFKDHLNKYLRQGEDVSIVPRHWDNSVIMQSKLGRYFLFENIVYFLLLTGPSIRCVWYLWVSGVRLTKLGFWEAGLCSLIVIFLFGPSALRRHLLPLQKKN